ncbi:hypothetical protein KUTeg_009525 [Tegillarca granosa]|uniref:Uncharacterized protein n=1 Tax=Tegillarca granosa TaxID=220873 RepID=A0ABQ9F796_TEGGR|nr:hypothetical protein KUTeg_009525 [Tegillarca granosa]
MSLQKVEDKAVVPADTVQVVRKKKPGLETIIERDFYPDLPKLKNQSEYFEALEKNDHVKLREIQMKFGDSTPATFETPEPGRKATSPVHRNRDKTLEAQREEKLSYDTESENKDDKISKNVTLDKFLSKNTSEDNASFEDILTETQKKHREKHAWLYENEDSRKKEEEVRLALPNIETQAITQNEQAGVDSWKYQIKNSLMYVPDGCELSASEIIDLKKSKPREIIHANSRFQYNPWNQMKSKEMLAKAASDKAVSNCGKIGHDGKEILPTETPKINGYGFVATPSPAPGVDESPLMTWGEIEGTPFRLEGGATPLVNAGAPAFKIPDIPRRDQIGMELAEKASKAHRDKKEKALKSLPANLE